jgi:RNA polymerase sigma factor (sigma-70 family)
MLDFRVAALGELDVVYAVARMISGSPTWAKKALPTVMLSAYRGWPDRPPEIRPRVWMLMMLAHYVERAGAASIATELDDPEPEAEPADPEKGPSRATVRHAFRGMSLQERLVVALSDVASLSYDEVGEVLEVGREEVRQRLLGTRARLRRKLNVDDSAALARRL